MIWNSKTDAEAAWKIWNTNENVTAWTEVDFFWGNFYQSEEARQAFEAEWQNLNPEVEDNWNMVSDCLEPRYYNSAEVPTS